MKRECHHICKLFDGSKSARYGFGDKKCSVCEYAFRPNYDGYYCPCCGGDLKFYYPDVQKQYAANNYSSEYLAEIERRKKRQCVWCGNRISKHAQFRIHGNPKDADSYVSFYQEWRSDSLGNIICYDCWRYNWIFQNLENRLTRIANSIIVNEINLPEGLYEKLKQVFAMYATEKPKEEIPADIYNSLI